VNKAQAAFSRWYYTKQPFLTHHWMGVPLVKCPFDLHSYQELIYETKPTLIVETGTFAGGSALYFAHLFDILGEGRVVTVDIREADVIQLPEHERIGYIQGVSSTDLAVVEHIRRNAKGERVMVVLDSDHTRNHVLRELELYHRLVSTGCYLVVEDTNMDAEIFVPGALKDGGPAAAIKAFQPTNHGFEVDHTRERDGFSFQPGGYLRRIR
jgi:cephalosporin hydroxylase